MLKVKNLYFKIGRILQMKNLKKVKELNLWGIKRDLHGPEGTGAPPPKYKVVKPPKPTCPPPPGSC
ncbi:MAG: hypothetical protein E7280_01810 [Lachnospiraceae bacterium]|nr:hypothetical protein [Lachnospiraceae bacterium]